MIPFENPFAKLSPDQIEEMKKTAMAVDLFIELDGRTRISVEEFRNMPGFAEVPTLPMAIGWMLGSSEFKGKYKMTPFIVTDDGVENVYDTIEDFILAGNSILQVKVYIDKVS